MQILFLFGLLLVLLLVRPITTTIHELGHAIPALLWSKEPVTIYVGSYGDPSNSKVWQWGRLTAFFSWDLAKWDMGVCTHGRLEKLTHSLLVVLGGPLASLVFGLGIGLFIWANSFGITIIFLLTFFGVSFIWDFLVNITPNERPIKLHNGRSTYNDGYQLQQLLRVIRYPEAYFIAAQKRGEKDYEGALNSYQEVLDQGFTNADVFREMAYVYILKKDYQSALQCYVNLKAHHKLKPEDMAQVGFIYLKKGEYRSTIKYCSQSLYLNFKDVITLNNRGYAYTQIGEYEKAIKDLEIAIAYQPKYAFAYNNLGMALVKTNQLEKGYQMLQKSLELDSKNPYVFLHLGFYYERKGELDNALTYFQKAKALGIDHHGIDFYIEETKRGL